MNPSGKKQDAYCKKCIKEFGDTHKSLWFKAYFNESYGQPPIYCRIHATPQMVDVVRVGDDDDARNKNKNKL